MRFHILLLVLILPFFYVNAQNVGIGEATPNTKFEIKGDSGNDLLNVKDQSGDSKLYILNNGNVGIGRTSPKELLEVTGQVVRVRDDGRITGAIAPQVPVPSILNASEAGYSVTAENDFDPNIAGESDPCSGLKTYADAVAYAESQGARLPTIEELESDVTKGTGCGYDSDYIWTQTKCGPNAYFVSPGSSANLSSMPRECRVATDQAYVRMVAEVDKGNLPAITDGEGALRTDKIKARVGNGIELVDDNDNRGIYIQDGGSISLQIGTAVNEFSTDVNLGNSNNIIPTQDAVKTYVDNQVSGSDEWNESSGVVYPKNATDEVLIGSTNTADAGYELNVNGTLNFLTEEGILYQPLEGGIPSNRYAMRFDLTNDASYPYLTNRTPNGAVVIKTGTASGGGENEHFRIEGGDGTVDAYFTNANVGIGVPNPSAALDVAGNVEVNDNMLRFSRTDQGQIYLDSGDDFHLRNNQQDNEIVIYDGGGGIGLFYNGTETFEVASGITVRDQTDFTGNNVSNINNLNVDGNASIGSNSTALNSIPAKVFIDGDPDNYGLVISKEFDSPDEPAALLIATDADGTDDIAIEVRGNTSGSSVSHPSSWASSSSSSDTKFVVFGDGTTVIGKGNVGDQYSTPNGAMLEVNGKIKSSGINETSDQRMKKDIQPLCGAIGKIKKLQGVSYYWKTEEFPDRNFTDKKEIGVIAQQVEGVFPELVDTDGEGYKSVQYSHLVPVLIEALKEQQEIIENKNTEMQAMQESIKVLQADMKAVKEAQQMSAKK